MLKRKVENVQAGHAIVAVHVKCMPCHHAHWVYLPLSQSLLDNSVSQGGGRKGGNVDLLSWKISVEWSDARQWKVNQASRILLLLCKQRHSSVTPSIRMILAPAPTCTGKKRKRGKEKKPPLRYNIFYSSNPIRGTEVFKSMRALSLSYIYICISLIYI